jgi:hypothetical protein
MQAPGFTRQNKDALCLYDAGHFRRVTRLSVSLSQKNAAPVEASGRSLGIQLYIFVFRVYIKFGKQKDGRPISL